MRRGLVFAIFTLILASCGGEQDASSGALESAKPIALPEGSTKKSDYVRRVNAICALRGSGYKAAIGRALKRQLAAGRPPSEAAYRAIIGEFPLVATWFQRALAIPPPPGDRAELERFWGYIVQGLQTVQDSIDAYESGDIEGLRRSEEALDEQESANRFAESYGIPKCTGFTDSETIQFKEQLRSADEIYTGG